VAWLSLVLKELRFDGGGKFADFARGEKRFLDLLARPSLRILAKRGAK